jgi:2-polyprenyl-3-methyl-5-hydroxy-6-metoxy-1,4-benzoquinol methylase
MLELVGSAKDVLDIGCGTGSGTDYLGSVLIAQGCKVSGVEKEATAAQHASKLYERVVVADPDVLDLEGEFGRESFDVVVFGDALEHLRDPLRVLRGARPLLRARGYIVVSRPSVTRESLVEFLAEGGYVLAELRRGRPIDTASDGGDGATHQYVMSAIPHDATAIEAQQALRVEELSGDCDRLKAEVARLSGKLREQLVVNQYLEQELKARGGSTREIEAVASVRQLARRALGTARAARDRSR